LLFTENKKGETNMEKWTLSDRVVEKSIADNWDEARLEWDLINVLMLENEYESCECGHYTIKEVCTIYNNNTKEQLDIGNCCIKKFEREEMDVTDLIRCMKNIYGDESKSLNKEALKYCFEHKIINRAQYKYYIEIWRKRKLTESQLERKIEINQIILKKAFKNGI